VGPLPASGQWVQLSVPASVVGLDGAAIDGFTLGMYDGQANLDRVGALSKSTSVPAMADAYVQGGTTANTNYGSAQIIVVKRLTNDSSSTYNRCSYLKFDLTDVTVAPKSASLQLTVNSGSTPSNSSETASLYSVSDTTWTETGVTWNNAPGLNRANFSSTGTFLASKTVPLVPGILTFDVTSFIASHMGQVVTLQLMDTAAENVYLDINSREAASGKPAIALSY
jgi:hypothetical protein